MNSNRRTSRQIVQAAIAGEATTRPAVGPLAVHYCARVAGVTIEEYSTNPGVLADCVIKYYDQFRPDAIWLSADTWVTAEAMGAPVGFPGPNQPMSGIGEPHIRTAADVLRIPPPDPTSQGRFPMMIEALQRIREAIGPEVFVIACLDQYPFSLACALMGIHNVMLNLIDDRPLVEAVMECGLEYGLVYGQALADAGANMLSGGDSPAGLIGPQRYQDVALPFERQLIERLRSSGAPSISLHICGDTMPILPHMGASGADVLELDFPIDLREACRVLGPNVAIWGNLDPVGVLAQGTPDIVCHATRELLRTIDECGHRRFVLSSGCTLAVDTPPENLLAMFEVAREWPAGQ